MSQPLCPICLTQHPPFTCREGTRDPKPGMALVCQECGAAFSVDVNQTPWPECPECGSEDYEVA